MRLLALIAIPALANSYEITGKTIHVSDGDTITILTSEYAKHKIRLNGIDAPERGQPYGNKSKQLLSKLIKGKQVTADCSDKDRYGRDICTIYNSGIDINATMVANGGAWVYRKYYKGKAYYEYENQAKSEKRGLWKTSEAQAIEPWKWRKGATNDESAPAVKLSKSGVCHEKGTKYYNKVKRYKRFDKVEECLKVGRLPK